MTKQERRAKQIILPYVGKILTRPTKRYKNLEDYRIRGVSGLREQKFVDNPDKWPCLECEGKTWIYDPDDSPCPVEGYKMVARLKCPMCKGTGFGCRELVREAYRERVAWDKAQIEQFDNAVKLYKEAIALLTPEQIKALQTFWRN